MIYVAQPPSTQMARTWIYPWSHSSPSFLAQALRSGSVRAIHHDPGAGWDPYGPGHEESLRSIAADYGIKWEQEGWRDQGAQAGNGNRE